MYEVLGDELEPLRLKSGLYRNNSSIVQNIMDLVVPTKDYRGYEPLFGTLTADAVKQNTATQVEKDTKSYTVDSLKFSYVDRLFSYVKSDGVQLLCIISPRFRVSSEDSQQAYTPIIELCKKHNIHFIDNRNYPGISGEMELFQDFGHLNDKGAKKYTASLIPLLRHSLQ